SQRTWIAIFLKILRIIATFSIITVPAIYLSLIDYNVELIPIKFLRPIVQFREGVALTPFLEILSLEIVTEFLREGGFRLPPKIASTLSIVGGITIGDMAIRSKMVSPTTLLIIGFCVISSFLIPNYEMAQSIVLLKFPMLVAANALGFLGITGMWFVILIHLFSMKNFGVPYFTIYKSDLKDTFMRYPLWQMEKRPESVPNNNKTKQGKFYFKWRRKNG
ncbi:MAG TPA: spore germination protein, partial [Clostridiaceae bacterium]|nr:spore germination protein [Clostridiaceae bacterium]